MNDIKLRTEDNKVFNVSHIISLADQNYSPISNEDLLDLNSDGDIPINYSSKYLTSFIELCEFFSNNQFEVPGPSGDFRVSSANLKDFLPDIAIDTTDFLENTKPTDLLKIAEIANFLAFVDIFNLICIKMATIIKYKPEAEIKDIFAVDKKTV